MRIQQKLDKIDCMLGINSITGKEGKIKGTLATLVKQACGAIPADVEIEYDGELGRVIKMHAEGKCDESDIQIL